jgi:large subunit ribosomal protein L24
MKFKTGDQVIVTAGKDKGSKAKIIKVLPEKNQVVVEGVNMYTRHMKPFGGQAGQKVRKERAMSLAKVAIINDQGKADRIAYAVGKDGQKTRIYKKTGKIIAS